LQANWIWVPGWTDSSGGNTAGRVVSFTRVINLEGILIAPALLHFSADTRYKLYINGTLVAVGPTRSSTLIWYHDTLDVASYLRPGHNEIKFVVVRYFNASRNAMPFARTAFPGLTVVGRIEAGSTSVEVDSRTGWMAQVDDGIEFPFGLIDDVFLHVSPPGDARPARLSFGMEEI
jgi:hypothetical protein